MIFIAASDGVKLAVTRHGDPGRPVIVLVHGYPDDSTVWDAVLAELGDFTTVTYDVRGAGASDRPRGRRSYRLSQLADDMRRVVDHASPDAPVHLVAHDWGSCAAWYAVSRTLAGRVATFTSISGPDLDRVRPWMRAELRRGLRGWARAARQMLSSAYVGFFVTPGPADLAVPLIARMVRADPSRDRAPVARADVRAGLNLYRANMLGRREPPREPGAPVQIVSPVRDRYVLTPLATSAAATVTRLDAGHWAPLSHPAEVAGAIRAFVGQT
jgi:pimeloyl-ACP methyl ester carboxylesterase